MKANLHKKAVPKGKGPFNGHEIRLTIGLIVKNEEKDLDKCLSSLKPLLDAVPSELIITDTGSTDSTVEIAKKYTDHIINFEWCNDFSAARNTGLFAARGEWFFYLDGDEWFEDVTPLVDFFNSGECDRYGTASYKVRNYGDFQGERYSDVYVCRLFRTYAGIHFHNQIHEDIDRMTPTKMIDAYAHHYGYVFPNKEERDKKNARNLGMLLGELKENPEDLKALFQISGEYISVNNYDKAIEYAKKGIEVGRKNGNVAYMKMVSILMQAYFNGGYDKELLDTLEDFLSNEPKQEVFHMEFFCMGQLSSFRLKRYENALILGRNYLRLYEDYTDGKLDRSMLLHSIFCSITPESRERCLVIHAKSLLALKKAEEALEYLRKLDLSKKDSTRNDSLTLCFDLADQMKNWAIPMEYYQKLLEIDDSVKIQDFIGYMESYLWNYPSKQSEILQEFAKAESDDDYFLLSRLRFSELENNREEALAVLDRFCKKRAKRNFYYSDVLYYLMKEKINFMPFLLETDSDDLPTVVTNIQRQHPDFADMIFDYFNAYSFENAKGLYGSVCLLERAVLAKNTEKDIEQYLKLFECYAENSAKYVRTVYRGEMFTPSNLAALPRAFRFGYHIGEAFAARDRSDSVSYLAELRAALSEYPIMEKPISLLLERFKKNQNMQDEKAREFASLARQVKQKIESLIDAGDLEQAGQVTMQLAKLMPEDEDVLRFQKLTHTEPTMKELATRFPQ